MRESPSKDTEFRADKEGHLARYMTWVCTIGGELMHVHRSSLRLLKTKNDLHKQGASGAEMGWFLWLFAQEHYSQGAGALGRYTKRCQRTKSSSGVLCQPNREERESKYGSIPTLEQPSQQIDSFNRLFTMVRTEQVKKSSNLSFIK
jgi:hypothetical protein